MTSVQVLETTLRDGSYAINFSFTTADTAAIASGLEAATRSTCRPRRRR